MFSKDSDRLSDTSVAVLDAFLAHQQPLHETGLVWVGGWRREDGPVEINATVVFPEHERDAAVRFAGLWDQMAVFDLGAGEPIETGGSGEGGIYDGDGLPDDWPAREPSRPPPPVTEAAVS